MSVLVRQRKDGQWEVRQETSGEALLSFEDQDGALEFAVSIARASQSKVVVFLPDENSGSKCLN